jgi:hypothetical protein
LRVPAGYPTQHKCCDHQVHVHRSCVAQTGNNKDIGDVQGGAESAPLAQRSHPRLGTSGKHPRSFVRCSQQHSVTSCHATASPRLGQSPCSRTCRPNHSYHVQTSRLGPLYKICFSALLLCAACTAKCYIFQRSMLPLQETEEQLDPRRVTLSDSGESIAPIEDSTIVRVMHRMVNYRSFFSVQGPGPK